MNTSTNPDIAVQPTSNGTSFKPTPGWKTSEFWMTTLGHVGLVLAASSGALPAQYAAIAGALSQLAYNLSRGLTKANADR